MGVLAHEACTKCSNEILLSISAERTKGAWGFWVCGFLRSAPPQLWKNVFLVTKLAYSSPLWQMAAREQRKVDGCEAAATNKCLFRLLLFLFFLCTLLGSLLCIFITWLGVPIM